MSSSHWSTMHFHIHSPCLGIKGTTSVAAAHAVVASVRVAHAGRGSSDDDLYSPCAAASVKAMLQDWSKGCWHAMVGLDV